MKNICEWENCKEVGTFKAPAEKDNSKNFKWLCKKHIKLFNNSWDYFDGMSQAEIENFLKSDVTWHRPTQKFGSLDNFFNALIIGDFLYVVTAKLSASYSFFLLLMNDKILITLLIGVYKIKNASF